MRSWLAVPWTLLFLLISLFAAVPHSTWALTPGQVYEQVKDSVVVVKAYDQKGQQVSLGSGVMLPSGDIITNYHVVKAGVRYIVGKHVDVTKLSDAELEKLANTPPSPYDNDIPGAKNTPATLKSINPDKDLCLLSATGSMAKPARLGKATNLKVGDPVYAVGAPQGLELSLSEGIVSQLRGGDPPIIQTTVAISPGSSGGGLFNAKGELVGITTFYLKDSQSLNFALPVEWVGEMAKRKDSGEDKNRWLVNGTALRKAEHWQDLMDHCQRWTKAEPGNALAWAGLGFACANLGRHNEEIKAYREALRLNPDDAATWNNLAIAYANSGNRSAALEAVKELRRLDPQMADKLFNLIMQP